MLNFHSLLTPISTLSPAGTDATFSAVVDSISKARHFDDPSLDQGEWVTDVKEADWNFVHEKCQELLATQSKDLKIASWLVEAATKLKHFEGMAAGFELMARLCDEFWDSVYPLGSDGNFDQRAGNMRWLATRAVQLAKEVPLTEGRGSQYSWIDFETARARTNNAAKQGIAITEADGQPTSAMMDAARLKSSRVFYESSINSLIHCQDMAKNMEASMDLKLGVDGPSFTPLKDVLDTILKTLKRYGADVGLKSVGGDATQAEDSAHGLAASVTPKHLEANFSGAVRSREEALSSLFGRQSGTVG
jgi:type VI secretion system protein ImpA